MTDEDNKFELNRRRVLGGIVTVGAAAAAAGAGTFAYFSDSETSSGNTVNAGTLGLDSTSGSFSATNIVPGESVPTSGGPASITTDYTGDVNAEVDLSFSLTEPSESGNTTNVSASELAGQLDITTATLSTASASQDLTSTSASPATLADLASSSFDNVLTVSDGETLTLDLEFTFNSNAGNDYQTDGVTTTVTFTAEQSNAD